MNRRAPPSPARLRCVSRDVAQPAQRSALARRGAAGRPGRRRPRRRRLRGWLLRPDLRDDRRSLQERAVAVAAKAQLVVEASGVMKVAAVAGAAAAVAGGGAVTVAAASEPVRPSGREPGGAQGRPRVPKATVAAAPAIFRSASCRAPAAERRARPSRTSDEVAHEFTVERRVPAAHRGTPPRLRRPPAGRGVRPRALTPAGPDRPPTRATLTTRTRKSHHEVAHGLRAQASILAASI